MFRGVRPERWGPPVQSEAPHALLLLTRPLPGLGESQALTGSPGAARRPPHSEDAMRVWGALRPPAAITAPKRRDVLLE